MADTPIPDQIEALVEEEHRLWRERGDGHGLSPEEHERLERIRAQLNACYEALRRRRAGAGDRVLGVPDPPNDLDEPPYDEPPHLERGGARENVASPDPGINPNVP